MGPRLGSHQCSTLQGRAGRLAPIDRPRSRVRDPFPDTRCAAAGLSGYPMNFFSFLPPSRFAVSLATITAGLAIGSELAAARVRPVAARSMISGYTIDALATDAARPAERAFLQKAAATSRLQQRLAELGASQATSSEVRSHAEQLKSDNRQLVDALTALIQRKQSATSPAVEPLTEPYAQLAQKSGVDFDREFVRTMARLHEETIAMFEQAASESKDTDVRDLAAAQLPMLRAHLNRITELKKTFD